MVENIPESWKYEILGNITEKIGSGITPSGGSKIYKLSGRPFIRSQNVLWGKLNLSEVAYIDDDTHNTFRGTEIKRGDVLLNITGASIGRSSVVVEKILGGNVNQHVCIIRPIKSKLISQFLCTYLLSSDGQKFIDSFQSGGNREGLNFKQIASISIPIPPLPEQKAIANALSGIDSLISSLEKLIDKKKNIKEGVMQELLTGKKRLDGFSGEWINIKLGEICEIKDGTHQTPKYVDTGIPFYSVESISKNEFKNTKFISEEEHAILTKSYKIEKGDILMTRIGSIGKCKYINWNVNASFYVSLALLKVKKAFCGEFIYHYSETGYFKNEIELNSLQSAIPKKINLGKISNVGLLIPPTFEEQTAIAKILSDMDKEIEKLNKKLNKYKEIKQGMMQELLTGKRRLI